MALYDISTAPSAKRIHQDIQTLVDFGTRHTLSETKSDTRGIGAARRWIFAEFEKISQDCGGCLEVIYVSDTISGEKRIPNPVEVMNVLAIQKGTLDPNRFVMMSGDIDSRVTDPLNGKSDSPGANDNASGMAGVIEEASGAVKASAVLKWERPTGKAASNLMGYRVHWRLTTAPEWTHSKFVGDVNVYELTNLVIDNYYFGVSCVAHDGSETPVVFPGAAGRF